MRFSLNESVVVRETWGRKPAEYAATVTKVARKYVTVSRLGTDSQPLRFDGDTGRYAHPDYPGHYQLLSLSDVANRAARKVAESALEAALADIRTAKLSTERMLALAEVINGALKCQ